MIKKAILGFLTRQNIKKRKREPSPDFRSARKVGLLFDHTFENSGDVDQLCEALTLAGKEVTTLNFCRNKEKLTTQKPCMDKRDIGIFGDIKGDHLHFFINQPYDYFICLDTTHHFAVDFVLSLAKSPCKVGLLDERRGELFDLMIKTDPDRNEPANEILKYLKMIHHDA